ncbi:hypothetical protein [Comamonas sp. JUb58]|uniref:hypothetical protein n=1 Tax=Comamonas sp. JUb58 TaxID=2485114 RepID=UPI00105B85BA|nr:hypothetical protein [Comamonas sp. JUb58]TDS69672.1 hypothetical protein EDF71_13211 [Comamonas sp. JUb58]
MDAVMIRPRKAVKAPACAAKPIPKIKQKTAGPTKLAKAETTALWHAVNWMATVLREWKLDGFKNDEDQAQHEVQSQHLTTAKRALSKMNKMRKEP